MEDIFWHAAGPLIGDDEPSAVLLAGMMVLAADGMLVNLADTPANRALFGSTGTADDSSPFPQLQGGRPHRPRGPREARARSWAPAGPGSRPC